MENLEENQISLKEFYFILKKRLKFVLSVSILILSVCIIYTLSLRPIYKSTSLVMVEDPSSAPTTDIFQTSMVQEKNFLSNEMEIIGSWTVSEKTIINLINSEYKNNLFLLGTRPYQSNWLRNLFYFDDILVNATEIKSSDKSALVKYIRKLRNGMSIKNQKNTDMIEISFSTIDPIEAALIANTIVDEYKKLDLAWNTGEMSHLKSFLVDQIDKKKVELLDSENLLKKFQEKEQIFTIDENSKLLLENLISAESKLYNLKSEGNILFERKKYIESQLTDEEKKLIDGVSNTINHRLYALKNEIALKEAELITAVSQQGEGHPVVNSIEDKLEKLKNQLELETRTLISQGISVADPIKYRQSLMDSVINITAISAMIESKVNELEKLVSEYDQDLSSLPQKILEFARLSRDLNIHSETYSLMRQKLEETRINEASQVGSIRIIDEARVSTSRVSPNMKLNFLAGLILSLIISIMLAFLIEHFDRTVKSLDEIESYGFPILAIIPSMGRDKKNKKTKKYQIKIGNAEKVERRLLTHEDPKSPVSEAYRGLRTSLMYDKQNNENKVILISSTGPGEGKTTTIANLAIAYADLGKKTILIDTDLRKPIINKIFSIEKDPGLTKYLSGNENNFTKIISETSIDNLSIITSGIIPPNPSEMLASERMVELLDELKKVYDVILLDSPPLLAVTDTLVSMKFVDQFFLVVRAMKTDKLGLKRSIELLKQANAPISGIVLNAVDETTSYGGGYYYNYYQYYYGDK
ncbi:hypothetical protein CL656_04450 [bacterium]|nr:hypothetical protein [bacterium]